MFRIIVLLGLLNTLLLGGSSLVWAKQDPVTPFRKTKEIKPPPISAPLVAPSPTPVERVSLDFGLGQYTLPPRGSGNVGGAPQNPVQGAENATHTSAAFALHYEARSQRGLFGFNLRIPFGFADSEFMIGNIHMRFRWQILQNHKSKTYFSLGFEVDLPSVLLNTLGGRRGDIFARRNQLGIYRTADLGGWNQFPMRYLNIGPQLAFAQKVGPVTLGAHFLLSFGIMSVAHNLYEAPNLELIVAYDLYAVYEILKGGLLEALVEFNGTSIAQQPTYNDDEYGTGLGLTLGVRSRFAKRFEAGLGFQFVLPTGDHRPHKEKRGFDLAAFYHHDWSLLFRIGVML